MNTPTTTTSAEALVSLLQDLVIGAGVYPLVVPQGASRPAIAYQAVSLNEVVSHAGYSGLARERWQLTVEADTYASVRAVARAVKRRLRGLDTTVGDLRVQTRIDNVSDGYADVGGQSGNGGVPVVRLDVLMWHDEQ